VQPAQRPTLTKWRSLAQDYPEDPEAEIFDALALLASADPLDKTYKNQLKAGAILERLFVEMPGHPGVSHYIIHAYDYPALAESGAGGGAKLCGVRDHRAHAIHMPSHPTSCSAVARHDQCQRREADARTRRSNRRG
jgi:hypothetical protein